MKSSNLTYGSAVLFIMLSSVATWLFANGVWLIGGLVVATVVLIVLMYGSLQRTVRYLSHQTAILLNQESKKYSVQTIHALGNDLSLVKRKLEESAKGIAKLGRQEIIDQLDVLISEDPIGIALKNASTEMNSLKQEDQKRKWIAEGLAFFSEILRNKGELNEFSHQIISNLVRYLNVNQGAIYLENKDEEGQRYLQLTGCYAYDRKKFVDSRIALGDGLLGQCMLEKEFVMITEVPKDYVKITSGLGAATPRAIIVAPLVVREVFYGAIELASFEVLQLHEVEFLKRVCENIAGEMASIKSLSDTQKLLNDSNILANELQLREEEMRQNLEELSATQEEMSRKQSELTGVFEALNSTLATAELKEDGRIVNCNSNLLLLFGGSEAQLKSHSFLLLTGERLAWKDVLTGRVTSGDFETQTLQGNHLWLSITFTCMRGGQGEVLKVLCLIQDITHRKDKELEFERLSLVANNTDNSVIITDAQGITQYVNAGFTKMTGYAPEDIIGKKPGALLQGPLTDQSTVAKVSGQLKKHVPIYEEILNYNKKGGTYWVSLAINPVRDTKGHVVQFISIQADITTTKIKALDFHQKMEALGKANAILELDPNGIIQDINDNYLQLLGYKRHELVGKSYEVITRKPHIFSKLMKSIKDEGVQKGEFTRFDKSGERHCMRLMDYPVTDLSGNLVKILEFGTDITNEKKLARIAERRNVELNSYLSAINNTIASAEFHLDGSYLSGNDMFLKVMGYKNHDLIGSEYTRILADQEQGRLMWENLKSGKFFSGEFIVKDALGKNLWMNGTFSPIIGIDGDIEKITMLAQFATQEKEKLNDLTVMVNAVKSTLPIVEFNDQFACKSANDRFMKIFGLTRMTLREKTLFDFVEGFTPGDPLFETILRKDNSNMVLPFRSGDKSVFFEISLSVVHNLSGSIAKIILIMVKEVDERVPVFAAV